ncbi:tyrosine-protein phosphatase [Rhodovulum sp. DZ06]|uniref:tyrosine-protein phosphatase n=1 Tax=Rhodovulum sp. DZ06 TaxID=3425126 RepID=UPI003D355265
MSDDRTPTGAPDASGPAAAPRDVAQADAAPDAAPRPMTKREMDEARWSRPIDSPRRRFDVWMNSIFVDHAFIRMVHLNFHKVGRLAFRSAQPLPGQIARMAKRHGIRTIISLRGGFRFGSLPLEKEACLENGIDFRTTVLRSRALPTQAELDAVRKLVEEVERPVLFHCKAGADRAGLMSALWLILAEGRPVAEARKQLSLKFGHVRGGPTGILDLFMDRAEEAEARGVPFLEWFETEYDREALTAEFKASGKNKFGTWLVDTLLRRE